MSVYDKNGILVADIGGGSGGGGDIDGYTTISSNLLDQSKITRPTGAAYMNCPMENGYYIDIEGGVSLCSNRRFGTAYFYTSEKEQISSVGPTNPTGAIGGVLIPSNAKYCRVVWTGLATDTSGLYVTATNDVALYTSSNPYPNTDLRSYIPHVMLDAGMIYGSLDQSAFGEEMVRMSKLLSIRAMNESRHSLRIANWNVYGAQRVAVGTTGNWDAVGRVLANFGIDICGFEEVKYAPSGTTANQNLPDHLISRRPWQFGYGNTNIPSGTTWSPLSNRAMVSRFEVLESTEVPTYVDSGSYNNRSFLYTKVALPRYYDCMGGQQYLAFYVIHPTVATEENQTLEWQVLINHLQANKCAFKIVVSDTNDWFYNSSGYPVHWAMLENVGLTAVNDGTPKTQTGANDIDEQGNPTNDQSYGHDSLDNIFVSSNIHVKDWNVISVWDMERLANGKAISDHDLIYADLEFDYSDLIVPMRPMTEWIAVIQNLTHCTSSYVPTYDNPLNMQRWDMTQAFSCTLTPDTGYTLSSVTVKVGGTNKTSQYYSNGTVSVPASAMSAGDILITAVATEAT